MASPPQSGLAAAPAGSRQQDLGEVLNGQLEEVSRRFEDVLAAGVKLEEDGEVTLVLSDPSRAFDLAVALQEAVWPVRLCFSITAPGPEEAAELRKQAKAGLEKTGKGRAFHFQVQGKSKSELRLAQEAAGLHAAIVSEWTPTRAAAVRRYRLLKKQAEVAKEMGVSQQAISQMLVGARFRDLASTEDALRDWLTEPAAPGIWPLRRNRG